MTDRDDPGPGGADGRPPSWQGAPGWSGVDPESLPPHAPLPGAPPYPPGSEPDRVAPAAPPARRPLVRAVAASAGWVVVALLVALVTGVPSWPLRIAALLLPWAVTVVALLLPARRGVGPGALVALAFGPFWLLHAVAVAVLQW